MRKSSYYSHISAGNEGEYSDYSEEFSDDEYGDSSEDDSSDYRRSRRGQTSKFGRRSSYNQARWGPRKSNISPSTSTLGLFGLFGLLLIIFLGWMGLRALDKSDREADIPPNQSEGDFRTTDDYWRTMIMKHPDILPAMWKADNRDTWWTEQSAQNWPSVEDKKGQESSYRCLTDAGRMEFMRRCLQIEADKEDTLTNPKHVEAHRKKRWAEYPKKLPDGKIVWRKRPVLHPNSWIKYEYRYIKYILYLLLGACLIGVVVLFFIIAGNNNWNWNAMNDGVFTSVSPNTSGNVFAEGSVDGAGTFAEAATQQRLTSNIFTQG